MLTACRITRDFTGPELVWWNAGWKFLALAINVHSVQPVLHCATNIKLIISHFCLLGNTTVLFIILFTTSSEATPLIPSAHPLHPHTHACTHTHTHTHTPANPTRGCSSLMKEKITHRQSGSHTKMPALHTAFSSTKYLTRCHWHYLKWLHLAEVNATEQNNYSYGKFSPFDNLTPTGQPHPAVPTLGAQTPTTI